MLKTLLREFKKYIKFVSFSLIIMLFVWTILFGLDIIDVEQTNKLSAILYNLSAPILTIIAIFLTFLAFYIQKVANDNTTKQFRKQERKESQDFMFNGFKDRIYLIANDVNNFNVSFHKNKLITNTLEIDENSGKKYNFVGTQAVSLFLFAYFEESEKNPDNVVFNDFRKKTYNSLFIQINNILSFFSKIHLDLEHSKLNPLYKKEISEMLRYTYFTKIIYLTEGIVLNEFCTEEIKNKFIHIYKYYSEEESGQLPAQ